MTDPTFRHVRCWFDRLSRGTSGTTAIEYGLIAALIAVALMASFGGVAGLTKTLWGGVSTAVEQAR